MAVGRQRSLVDRGWGVVIVFIEEVSVRALSEWDEAFAIRTPAVIVSQYTA